MIKILIAEDEAKSRAAMASRVRSIMGEGALIETAEDGSGAVAKAIQIKPDLIFMDIEMPHKNGLEAAAIIKRQLPETKIVFLTAYDRFDYAVGALRAGGEEYLLKPASETVLRETLQRFFTVEPEPEPDCSLFESSLRVWVHQHYKEDISLEEAAESMGMSPFYFSRQVKMTTGHTFLHFLTGYRIDKAKRRLCSTEMSVSEVGRSVGYSDPNYFIKVFKRTTGYTPSEYRCRENEPVK